MTQKISRFAINFTQWFSRNLWT